MINCLAAMKGGALAMFYAVRPLVLSQVLLHLGLSGLCILMAAVSATSRCPQSCALAAGLVAIVSLCRVAVTVGLGCAQIATANAMAAANATRKQRIWYNRWHLWSRIGLFIMILQVIGAIYFNVTTLKRESNDYGGEHAYCTPRGSAHAKELLQKLFVIIVVLAWTLVVLQCCVGSTILQWRHFYKEHPEAWRAHYREKFSHGIKELLCCMGKWKYVQYSADDEVKHVASFLGELVSYRATGATHLELLGGISCLQVCRPLMSQSLEKFPNAPDALVMEATLLHHYAVAAYTGLLLDFGRHPLRFLCAWIHRQSLLAPWNRSRRATIEGDNWWRGHAAAFLKGSQLPPEALLKGRVRQKRRETVYFVAVVQQLHTIVIAVRGTESPEDLLTDGLCRECTLSDSDLSGLMNCSSLPENLKKKLDDTKPHFAHAGVLEAAKELVLQLDNLTDGDDGSSASKGFLSSLVGPGGKYESYDLKFVGHSLGGAVAAVAALLLYKRHQSLHVYTYGALPCLDLLTAEACNTFITSVVYNDEFSSRLSVAAVLRLRASALQALAADVGTDSASIARRLRPFSCLQQIREIESNGLGDQHPRNVTLSSGKHSQRQRHFQYILKGGFCLCYYTCQCVVHTSKYSSSSPLNDAKAEAFVRRQNETNVGVHHDQSEKGSYALKVDHEAPQTLQNGAHTSAVGHNLSSQVLAERADTTTDAVGFCQHDSNSNSSFEGGKIVLHGPLNNGLTYFRNVEDKRTQTQNHGDDSEQEGKQENGDLQTSDGQAVETASQVEGHAHASLHPSSDIYESYPVELFIPGLVIHIVHDEGDGHLPSRRLRTTDTTSKTRYRAILRDRESFKDIVISPSMFLDHMPWRCQHALKSVMDQQVSKSSLVDLV